MSAADRMSVWAIYDNPLDHPERFVVREWSVEGSVVTPSNEVSLFDTLEDARASLPAGLALSPVPEPDPAIVEVWL